MLILQPFLPTKAISTGLAILLVVSAFLSSYMRLVVTSDPPDGRGHEHWPRYTCRFTRVDRTLSQAPRHIYRDPF